MLKVANLVAGYGSLTVLKDLSFEVPSGKVVALLGGNGGGKTTTLRTIVGLIRPRNGTIAFDETRIDGFPPHRVFAHGLSLVPQGRELFSEMTVAENLELGALQRGSRSNYDNRLDQVLEFLPSLRKHLDRRAGILSGGQQQMLATARALMSNPRLLMLDEPSTGLGPLVVAELHELIERICRAGTTVLLVEQNIKLALSVAHYVYVIRNGSIATEGDPSSFRDQRALFNSYIG